MSQPKTQAIPALDLNPQLKALRPEIDAAIARVLDSGIFVLGPEVEAFEREAADYLGVKHAVGLNSGTDALVIALRALDIGPGDEVITTPFSFFATAESISMVGAKPVFVDIDEHTFNLNPDLIEAAINERTKAIIPVHLFGLPADMLRIVDIAKKHKLKVIEDAAQSFGATVDGKQTGSIGDVGTFSFYPTKNLGALGDGGLLTTNSDEVAELAKMLRNHGQKRRYYNAMLGYNSRLDAMQAAILRVKLPYIDTWNQQRLEAAERYNEMLSAVKGVITPSLPKGHSVHQYTLRVPNRDELHRSLQEAGIGAMIYYPVPQDKSPVYCKQDSVTPLSGQLSQQVISLPIWSEIAEAVQLHVVEALIHSLE